MPRSCSSNWAVARLADFSENTRTEENKKLYWSNSQKARNKREVHSSQVQLDTKGKIGKSFFAEQAVFCLWKVENWGWLRFLSCSRPDNPEKILLKSVDPINVCCCLLIIMSLWFRKYFTCVPRRKDKHQQPKKKNLSPTEAIDLIDYRLTLFLSSFFSGRVHSAMVSKINPPQRSVTVEWYERGETKGKEVELDMLISLNPELIQNSKIYVAPPPTAPAPVNLQRVSSRELTF